jgi:hypothetical protein
MCRFPSCSSACRASSTFSRRQQITPIFCSDQRLWPRIQRHRQELKPDFGADLRYTPEPAPGELEWSRTHTPTHSTENPPSFHRAATLRRYPTDG